MELNTQRLIVWYLGMMGISVLFSLFRASDFDDFKWRILLSILWPLTIIVGILLKLNDFINWLAGGDS